MPKLLQVQVWPPINLKKFETLSYLPPLSTASLANEVDYLLRMGWVPCLEFELEVIIYLSLSIFIHLLKKNSVWSSIPQNYIAYIQLLKFK